MANVLVVDDEKNIRSHLATYLRGLGHRVRGRRRRRRGAATRRRGAVRPRALGRAHGGHGRHVAAARAAPAPSRRGRRADDRVRDDPGRGRGDARGRVPLPREAVRARRGRAARRARARGRAGCGATTASCAARSTTPPLLDSRAEAMRRALETARRAAESDVTVLLLGESGTGKNVLARAIHGWSARHAAPFVTVSCTTLAEHLLESELFGHVKGAFTGALEGQAGPARGGGRRHDLPRRDRRARARAPGEAAALPRGAPLRARRRHAHARGRRADRRGDQPRPRGGGARAAASAPISSTGSPSSSVRVPPLRERREDLPALVEHLLARARRAPPPRAPARSTPAALEAIAAYAWPGNVRELANALERALVLSRGDAIGAESLPDAVLAPPRELPTARRRVALARRRRAPPHPAGDRELADARGRRGAARHRPDHAVAQAQALGIGLTRRRVGDVAQAQR